MNLARLKDELSLVVRDVSMEPRFADWLNDAVEEIALEVDLPALRLLSPEPFIVTATDWLYDPPDNFHKNLFRAADSEWQPIRICQRWEELDAADLDHDEVDTHVSRIAVTEDGGQIGIYPMAAETISLWFYEKPTPMDKEGDEPDCIPATYRSRLIISKVVVKNFKLLQDLMTEPPHQSLQWWQTEYLKGLHGEPRGDIGLLNYLAVRRKPRRHGGRQPLP
jgi:hypothetical protein